jgi:hypothetical protein
VECTKPRGRPQQQQQHQQQQQPIVRDEPDPPPASSGCVAKPSAPSGYLTIDSKPFSRFFMNGIELGETPISRKSLPSGCAELKAVAVDGKKSSTFRVEIQPGLVTVYTHEF